MNGLQNPANEYDFGYDFNYALWTPDTRVTLLNVPWNNDYRDIVKFADKAALNTYLNSIEGAGIVIEDMSYIKPNMPVRIPTPFNRAIKYNYLRASNPLQPVTPSDVQKDFYYFITDVRYIAPNTTEIVVQLDVWQTFGYDVTFGNSYIERGHIGIANENNFDNYGRDYLTIPEGIDIGGEYQIIAKRTEKILELDGEQGSDSINSTVLVVSTVNLDVNPGSETDPHLETASGGNFQGLPSGAALYAFHGTQEFQAFMGNYAQYPWITQGIVSITLIPDIKRYAPGFAYTGYDPETNPTGGTNLIFKAVRLNNVKHELFEDWRDSTEILEKIPERYRHLKKFLTFPYMVIELTTFTGTPIIIKPEAWADGDATVIERPALVPPNQRISFHPFKYNALPGSATDPAHDNGHDNDPEDGYYIGGDDNGEFVDFATQISNFPTLAIVNNAAIGYLAANAHGIAYSQQSAGWQQQRALRGNELSYDQATSGMALANELTALGINTDQLQTALQNMTNWQQGFVGSVGGIAGGAGLGAVHGGAAGAAAGAAGGALGMLTGGISQAISQNANVQGLAIRNSQANRANSAQQGNSGFVRDTNKAVGDWAARGDYENTISGINAKVQDAKLTQPTTSGQLGGEMINAIQNNFAVSARWRFIDKAAMSVVGELWLRYGYAVRRFAQMPASLQVMTKFTYWKLTESYVIAVGMPETFKQVIRGIFEKGVTVWADPNDIGQIDLADNEPLEGVTL